ncbi:MULTISPECIES: hypothetical protein [unclassified Burkholderia]|uniref:hypothetical protein n=1 Tax=unclassified Burkholderia TaxID=2613784 RepID=UPI00075A9043|nr:MULTISPECIES: hypothetical protein [unclassified Burkholderia]KUZ00593.1 hypothetical protein WS48_05750 [Burkholderia sp. RF7-non_BP1]KUZ04369.1 hypothetical protein WS49_08300 [Burkholderia sp. RF7-non_BP4]
MTRAERPDGSPVRQSKPAWGPGKSAALSIIAFAAIFGGFAYVQRDAGVGHATVTHDIAGMIGSTVGKYRNAIAAATADASRAASTVAQAEPVTPSVPGTPHASATSAVSATAAPAASPRTTARAAAKHPHPAHVPPTTLAANALAASAGDRAARPGDTHRTSRSQALASTKKHTDPAPRRQPQSYLADSPHMEATSVTRDELEGARALARARWCARIDEWNCVEQNASRALAIDPKNSESRALLGQAIRNRL